MDIGSQFSGWAGGIWAFLPHLVGALAVLIIGWIVALVAKGLVHKGLSALHLNQRTHEHLPSLDLERTAAGTVFWIIILLTLVGTFNVLRIDSVSGPLSALATTIMLYLPRILLAAALAVLAWIAATMVRKVVSRTATALDKRLVQSERADGGKPVSGTLGGMLFWIVILLFLPAIASALQMQGLLSPLTNMVERFLAFVPNLVAALFILGIGYLIAKVLREIVGNLLGATRIDALITGSAGKPGIRISQLCATLVFIVVLVPAVIAALGALQVEVVAEPARHMLQLFLAAVPNIVAAAAILFIAWLVGRFIESMLAQLLAQVGFDRIPAHLGLAPMPAEAPEPAAADTPPSGIVGRIVLWFVMAFAVVEAANRLGFTGVNGLVDQLIAFAAQVLFGLVILAVGQWLATLAARTIQRTGSEHRVALSRVARVAILGLVVAMGLHAMGFADSIVNLAFGLVLGAVAVAVALAFGLGGRDAAGRITRHWADRYLGNDNR